MSVALHWWGDVKTCKRLERMLISTPLLPSIFVHDMQENKNAKFEILYLLFFFFFMGGRGRGYLTSTFLVEALFSSDKQIIRKLTNNKMEVKLSDSVHFIVCVCCLKKVLALKMCTVLYCLIKISILFNLLCVLILFQNASSHLCFRFCFPPSLTSRFWPLTAPFPLYL